MTFCFYALFMFPLQGFQVVYESLSCHGASADGSMSIGRDKHVYRPVDMRVSAATRRKNACSREICKRIQRV